MINIFFLFPEGYPRVYWYCLTSCAKGLLLRRGLIAIDICCGGPDFRLSGLRLSVQAYAGRLCRERLIPNVFLIV